MDPHLEVIDAFVDGERVDPAALKHALSDPAGRDYFVDVWMLREVVQHDPEIAVASRRPVAPPPQQRARPWMVAAALVAGLAGGYLVGSRLPASSFSASPATVATTTTVRPTPAKDVFPAPPPTRVIQLEFRVDSNGSGGD